MRIDYSEPKKSYSFPQGNSSRPRKEYSGGGWIITGITAILCLGIGFGSGWMLSQRAAKKGFKAAMEQQSLENTQQQAKIPPSPQQPPPVATQAVTQPPSAGDPALQPATPRGVPSAVEPPLSFYKTLPSGQKSNAMGSGINPIEDKQQKQTLQAAVPTNITKPAPLSKDETVQKQQSRAQPVKPVVPARPDTSGLTVQAASFSLKSEAETLRGKLAAKGYNVTISESHLGDKGTWYRVLVGRHLGPDAAKELAGKLGKGAIAIPDKD